MTTIAIFLAVIIIFACIIIKTLVCIDNEIEEMHDTIDESYHKDTPK